MSSRQPTERHSEPQQRKQAMKTTGYRQQMELINEAAKFQRELPNGRIIIYSEMPSDYTIRFWLCFQPRIDAPCVFTVGGQKYLDKDGAWREPHGAKSRRHFNSQITISR
jgi:hypothetical protein